MLYEKLGMARIIQFSQRNGRLLLPRRKQGNNPVIPIYVIHTVQYFIYGLKLMFLRFYMFIIM